MADRTTNSRYRSPITGFENITAENYGQWIGKAKAVLRRDNLWKYTQPPLVDKDGKAVLPKDVDAEKELLEDAAEVLTFNISDSILDRLTKEEKTDGRKCWAKLEELLQRSGVRQYIALHRQYNTLKSNPKAEILIEFRTRERKILSDKKATGVQLPDNILEAACLMSAMPDKYATIMQVWYAMKDEDLTAESLFSMLENEESRQNQKRQISTATNTDAKKINVVGTAWNKGPLVRPRQQKGRGSGTGKGGNDRNVRGRGNQPVHMT
jgi:hypothetical protein